MQDEKTVVTLTKHELSILRVALSCYNVAMQEQAKNISDKTILTEILEDSDDIRAKLKG